MIKQTLVSATLASFLLIGCGSTDSTDTSDTTSTASSKVGYFVDSAVINLDYDCIADGDFNRTTGELGAFSCQNMNQVRFRLGNLVLGEITGLPEDSIVMPQDLVDVNRTDIYNQKVTEIARLLQSCDSDGNLTNGIEINATIKQELFALLDENTTFEDINTTLSELMDINATLDTNITDIYSQFTSRVRTETQARAHLHDTLQTIQTNALNTNITNIAIPQTGAIADVNASPISILTDEVKDAIEYMVNEEKLAYDVYMNLYNYHSSNSNTELFQFKNIAERSETRHMQTVEDLATKYGLEKASNLESGQFNVPEVQELYDALYEMGTASPEAALKVGCMVEVTDINDLEADIAIAEESNAQDVVDVFTVLRDGSYNHYWAFDKGLKSLGITGGCYVPGDELLGENKEGIYPHNQSGQNSTAGQRNGHRSGSGSGRGNGNRHRGR